ncbi:MAG: hypothetical protein ACOCXZ_00150 [Chloroflexota bacterium]
MKRLFGGGSGGGQYAVDRRGLYIYVRPKRCNEIVEVRINLMNDLSQDEQGEGYFVRKMVTAIRCPFQAEVELYFDKGRNITSSAVTNGELVDEIDYHNWLAEKEAQKTTEPAEE